MRVSVVSTQTLFSTPRLGVARMQSELVRLSKETTTGRFADVGMELGVRSGASARLHIDMTALTTVANSNATTSARVSETTAGLDHIASGADDFLKQLILSRDTGTWPQGQAASQLDTFVGTLNTSGTGGYLFGGVNSAARPLADFDAGPQAAIEAAFLAKFGIPIGDAAAADISATDMTDFLDNEFAALFDDPQWSTWSSASDQPIRSRVTPTESLDTSVSANQPAMRKLAMVYAMSAALGADGLGSGARQVLNSKAIELLGDGISDLTALRASVGVTTKRLADASERVEVQKSLLTTRIASLEGVDPAEAKTKLDTLTTQIEMSYSLTAKLLQFSILNYV